MASESGWEPNWLERLIYGPNCKYREGRIGYNKRFICERTYTTQTLVGFRIQYRLHCWIERVKNDEFNAALMLQPENRELLIDTYHKEVFQPFLERSGFFGFGWVNRIRLGREELATPWVFWFRLVERGRKTSVEYDPVCFATLAAVQQLPFCKHGCEVKVSRIEYIEPDDGFIEENFRMISEETLEAIERDGEYSRARELAVARLMNDLLNTRRSWYATMTDQTHNAGRLSVRTQRLGQTVKVSWGLKEGSQNSGYRVFGFRKEGEFGPDPWSEETNGARIIDSYQIEGSVIEELVAGRTYFYTMFLQKRDAGLFGIQSSPPTYSYYCSLRFTLRVPTAAETKELGQSIESIKPKSDPYWTRLEKSFEELRAKIKGVGALKTFERNMIADTQNRDDYKALSAKEQREWIDDISRLCEGLKFVVED